MSKRLVNYDPHSKTHTWHTYDHSSKTTKVVVVQDVEDILKHNKMKQNNTLYKQRGIKEGFYHFATIPNVVIEEWMKKYGVNVFVKDDLPKVEKLLNKAEYKYLRTVNKI